MYTNVVLRLLKPILLVGLALLFVSCGGGSSSSETSNPLTTSSIIQFQQSEVTTDEGGKLIFVVELMDRGLFLPLRWRIEYNDVVTDEDFSATQDNQNFITLTVEDATTAITISTFNDDLYEGETEVFQLIVEGIVDTTIDVNDISADTQISVVSISATGKIQNNDPIPQVRLTPPTTISEGDLAVFDLELVDASGTPMASYNDLEFRWDLLNTDTSSDRDVISADFEDRANTGIITFAKGRILASSYFAIRADMLYEGTENFLLRFSDIIGEFNDVTTEGEIFDSNLQPALTANNSENTEEGNDLVFYITMSTPVAADVSFDWSISPTQVDNDVVILPINATGTEVIPADTLSYELRIPTMQDNTSDGDRTVELDITNIEGLVSNIATETISAQGIITDYADGTALRFFYSSRPSRRIAEGDFLSLNVDLSQTVFNDVTFDWEIYEGSCPIPPSAPSSSRTLAVDDFLDATGTARIGTNSRRVSISSRVSEDNIYESDENFCFDITSNQVIFPNDSFNITVIDNETIPVLSFNDIIVQEDATARFILQLDKASATNITVSWMLLYGNTITDDFAASQSDTGTATILAGATSTDIAIAIFDDDESELEEFFFVSLESVSGAERLNPIANGIIQDNDALPELKELTGNLTINEGSNLKLTLVLNEASISRVILNWVIIPTTSGFNALQNDFVEIFGTTRILKGDSTTEFFIDAIDDDLYEGTEDFQVTVLVAEGTASRASVQYNGNILDNENAPFLQFVAPTSKSEYEKEEGESFPFRVAVKGVPRERASHFQWQVIFKTLPPQTTTSDFVEISGRETIPHDATSIVFDVDTVDDEIFEDAYSSLGRLSTSDSFSAKIIPIQGANRDSREATITRVIRDDNDHPGLVISFLTDQIEVAEGEQTFFVDVKGKESGVFLNSFLWGLAFGSTNAEDYESESFAVGGPGDAISGQRFPITIPLRHDGISEPNEFFSLTLNRIDPTIQIGRFSSINVTVVSEDDIPLISIRAIGDASETIAATSSIPFEVFLSNISDLDIPFQWYITNITTTTADFVAATGDGVITAGNLTAIIPVYATDDSIFELNESFSINIDITDDVAFLGISSANATIINDDHIPIITIKDQMIFEGDGNIITTINFEIVITGDTKSSHQEITVSWGLLPGGEATNDLVGGVPDFSIVNSLPVIIPSFANSAILDGIRILGDDIPEINERFFVFLSPDDLVDATLDVDATATGTILGDDGVFGSLVEDSIIITENIGGFFEFLPNVVGEDASLDWEIFLDNSADGADISADISDFRNTGASIASGDFTIRISDLNTEVPSNTFFIPNDDDIYEINETFRIIVRNRDGMEVASAVGSIRNDDNFPVVASENSSVVEGGEMRFRVSLTGGTLASYTDITLVPSFSTGGSATASTVDYVITNTGVLTIPAGSRYIDFTVDTIDDNIIEDNEIFTITFSGIEGAILESDGFASILVNGTIYDNDYTANVSGQLIEDRNNQLALRFSNNIDLNNDRTYTWNVLFGDDLTSASTNDLEKITGSFQGDSFSIPIMQDNVYEGIETFTLMIIDNGISNSISNREIFNEVLTIIDNENIPTLSIVGDSSVDEGNSLTLNIFLSGPTKFDVNFVLELDSVNNIAADINEPTFLGELISLITAEQNSFPSGTTGQAGSLVLPIFSDDIYEGDENFSVVISNITNATADGGGSFVSKDITIRDDNDFPNIIVSSATAREGDPVNFTVSLISISALAIEIDWEVIFGVGLSSSDLGSGASTSGTVSVGGGLGFVSNTVITPFSTRRDGISEGTEAFTLRITEIRDTNNYNTRTGNLAEATGFVTDIDGGATLFISGNDFIREGETSTVDIGLSHGSISDVSFDLEIRDISTTTNDITGVFLAGNPINRNVKHRVLFRNQAIEQLLILNIASDDRYEGTENFSIIISNIMNATADNGGTSISRNIAIIDPDGLPTISVAANATVNEGEEISFTFTASDTPVSDLTIDVDWSIIFDDTTTDDFSAEVSATGTFSIAPGSRIATVDFLTETDDIYEDSENFTLQITEVRDRLGYRSATTSLNSAVGTITDTVFPILTISNPQTETSESKPLKWDITSNIRSKYLIEITPTITGGENDVDYSIDTIITIDFRKRTTSELSIATLGTSVLETGLGFVLNDGVYSKTLEINFSEYTVNGKNQSTSVTPLTGKINQSIDFDEDGLIDIYDIDMLNHMRFNLNGTSYKNFSGADGYTKGCPSDSCAGYELVRDLDFEKEDADNVTWVRVTDRRGFEDDTGKILYTPSSEPSWVPIPNFKTTFDGNGYTISNLYVADSNTNNRNLGFFGRINFGAIIRNVRFMNALVYNRHISDGGQWNTLGILAGRNVGTITSSYAHGDVYSHNLSTYDRVGLLVGENAGNITDSSSSSYGTTYVGSNIRLGGLVGLNSITGKIINSHSNVNFNPRQYAVVGGLVGLNGGGRIAASYSTGIIRVDRGGIIGGLVGRMAGIDSRDSNIIASYSTVSLILRPSLITGANSVLGGLVGILGEHSELRSSYYRGRMGEISPPPSIDRRVNSNATYVGGIVGIRYALSENINRFSPVRNNYSAINVLYGFSRLDPELITSVSGIGAIGAGFGSAPALLDSRYVKKIASVSRFEVLENSFHYHYNGNSGSDLLSLNAQTSGWNASIWDFGNNNQIPALKYADYDAGGNKFICDGNDPGSSIPNCRELLPGQTGLGVPPIIYFIGNSVLWNKVRGDNFDYNLVSGTRAIYPIDGSRETYEQIFSGSNRSGIVIPSSNNGIFLKLQTCSRIDTNSCVDSYTIFR